MGLHVQVTNSSEPKSLSSRAAGLKIVAVNHDPRLDLRYDPDPKDKSTKIVFIQVVHLTLDGANILPSVFLARLSYMDKDTTARSFTVDYSAGEKDPYYNGDDKAPDGKRIDIGIQGDATLTPPRAATMDDTPGRDDVGWPAGKSKYIASFRTAVFSAAGADQGTYYEFQDWTFEKEKGHPSKLTVGSTGKDPGQDFKDAVTLWCKNNGFTLPAPLPPTKPPTPAPAPGVFPPSPPPPGPHSLKGTNYVVVRGDSLWKIAERAYGNGNLWPRIYEANKAVIGPNPNLIFPGQTFVIP